MILPPVLCLYHHLFLPHHQDCCFYRFILISLGSLFRFSAVYPHTYTHPAFTFLLFWGSVFPDRTAAFYHCHVHTPSPLPACHTHTSLPPHFVSHTCLCITHHYYHRPHSGTFYSTTTYHRDTISLGRLAHLTLHTFPGTCLFSHACWLPATTTGEPLQAFPHLPPHTPHHRHSPQAATIHTYCVQWFACLCCCHTCLEPCLPVPPHTTTTTFLWEDTFLPCHTHHPFSACQHGLHCRACLFYLPPCHTQSLQGTVLCLHLHLPPVLTTACVWAAFNACCVLLHGAFCKLLVLRLYRVLPIPPPATQYCTTLGRFWVLPRACMAGSHVHCYHLPPAYHYHLGYFVPAPVMPFTPERLRARLLLFTACTPPLLPYLVSSTTTAAH